MKVIVAIVKRHRVDDVIDELRKVPILGITTWEVLGFGAEPKEDVEIYRGHEYRLRLKPMELIMTAVTDDMVDNIMQTIRDYGNTGEISAGKIFVLDLVDIMRIRTGESGMAGLLVSEIELDQSQKPN